MPMPMLNSPALGIMNQMWAAPGTTDREALHIAIEETRLADELGFDSVWIGEHHRAKPGARFYGRVPAPEILLGYLAAGTRRIRLGTGVRVLSTTSAQRTAEEMSLLDALSGGRAEFGVGLGSTPDPQPGQESREAKAARFRGLLDELLAQLGAAPAPPEGALSPTPAPDLAARLWAAARDEPTLLHLARRGVNLVVGQAELPAVQARYVRAYRAAGGAGVVRGVRLAFVAETHAEAIAASERATELYVGQMSGKGYHREAQERGLLPLAPASPEAVRLGVNFLVGTPEEVADGLNDYVATTGVDRLDVMAQIPGLDTASVRRSMTLIQREVRPRLRVADAVAARSAA